jgi:hypothetical protein
VKITHILEEVNKGGEVINTIHVDLAKRRFFQSAQQEFTEDAVKRWKQARMWKARLTELNDMSAEASRKYKEAYENVKAEAERVLDQQIKATYANFDEKAEEEAISKHEDPRTIEWIENRIPDIILEMRKGILERDMELLPKEQATMDAKRRFNTQYKTAKKAALDKNSLVRRDKMQSRLGAKLEEFRKAEEDYMRQINSEKYNLEWSIREQFEAERALALSKLKFTPEVFSLVVPQSEQCEHLKSKAWGNSYGKGVTCVSCGKELTELFHEESQILGYGSGCNSKMYMDINRHRLDEASFKFDSTDHRLRIEKERMRLEKERRDMEEKEVYFYDFSDLQVIYEFDQRHASEIKRSGKFRQGLQWTETELVDYETRRREEKRQVRGLHRFCP